MADRGQKQQQYCPAQGSKTEDYRKRFMEADTDGDGYLSMLEFYTMMKMAGTKMTDRQIAETFVFFDGPRGDKRITFSEFSLGCQKIDEFQNKIRTLFLELDTSGDGQLQKDELRVLLDRSGRVVSDQELDTMFKELDRNGDKTVSLEEFVQYFS